MSYKICCEIILKNSMNIVFLLFLLDQNFCNFKIRVVNIFISKGDLNKLVLCVYIYTHIFWQVRVALWPPWFTRKAALMLGTLNAKNLALCTIPNRIWCQKVTIISPYFTLFYTKRKDFSVAFDEESWKISVMIAIKHVTLFCCRLLP